MSRPIAFRASSTSPCPVCSSASKGCSATDDGLHLCRGEPSLGWRTIGHTADNAGFGHYRREDDTAPRHDRRASTPPAVASPVVAPVEQRPKPIKDWSAVAKRYAAGIRSDAVAELATSLNLPEGALTAIQQLGVVGRSLEGWTFALPERNAAGEIVGVSQRFPDRSKKMILGSRRGLTIPPAWDRRPGPTLNVEGPTDTAALYHTGASVTGRPSNAGGVKLLAELYADLPADRDIIIVGENDKKENGNHPGLDGAKGVATALAMKLRRPVMWAMPPEGTKDVREWLTRAEHGQKSWAARGAELVAHLSTVAVTVQPAARDRITYTAADIAAMRAEPPLPVPAECAITVAADMRELFVPTCRCDNPRVMIGKKRKTHRRGAVPFGCHKLACCVCGLIKKGELFDSTEPYLKRLTTPEGETPAAMMIIQMVVSSARNVAVKRMVERCHGKFLAVDTTDPNGCHEIIREGEVSHLGQVGVCPTSLKCDTGPHTLWTVLLPTGTKTPKGFVPTSLATTYRAIGNALLTTPVPPDGVKRFRPIRKSRNWGDKVEREPGDFVPEGVSVYTQNEIRRFADELRVMASFWFADPRVQGRPVGWDVAPAASLCFSLLLRGIEAPRPYTIDRVIELGKSWLQALPRTVEDGWRVEGVLRKHLWYGPPYDSIEAELREADEQDKAAAEFDAEATAILASLRQRYRGREHEARGLVGEVLAW